MNVKKRLDQFIDGYDKNKGRKPNERYASFDYCYNYFYSFYEKNRLPELANEENNQVSCLQLGFYLASWGMMRGSSFLLEKSVRNFSSLIETISKMDPQLWKIDVPGYNDENMDILLDCKQQIITSLEKEKRPTDTLVTKIMLGVFANVPAFDTYFKKSLNVTSMNKKSLQHIKEFYLDNQADFDSYKIIHTYDFVTAKETKYVYTKAKLIDMYGFADGQQNQAS